MRHTRGAALSAQGGARFARAFQVIATVLTQRGLQIGLTKYGHGSGLAGMARHGRWPVAGAAPARLANFLKDELPEMLAHLRSGGLRRSLRQRCEPRSPR
ncbi:exported hypothetical protein [Cupriavidus oxalaticus]|uniref:Uncharacterized protein n=1 Tax=Cupriavidus oxalaticus TaxID=96344 RepID=A0A976BIS7_9BURK|nr:exported hypothetical protein [Cupriavidus oxalaticus]